MSWLSEATGIHISPQHGFHIDPKALLTNAMALTGNPLAIAGSIGNLAHAVSPNSTLGHLGETAETLGAIGGGLTGGLGGIGAAIGKTGLPGAQSVAGLLGAGGGGSAAEGAASAIPDAAMGLPASTAAAAPGAGGGLGGFLGKAGDFLGGNGGKNALGIAQGVNAALQQKQANDYAKQALSSVENSYNERAPLRAQGIKGLMTSQTGNPYATGTPTAPMPVRGY